MLIEAESIPSLAAAFDHVEVGTYSGERCQIILTDPSKRFVIEQKLPAIGRLIEQVTSRAVSIELTEREQDQDRPVATDESSLHAAASHPLVRQAQELFDARIVSIDPDHDSDDTTPTRPTRSRHGK